jgi:hypothetical protein
LRSYSKETSVELFEPTTIGNDKSNLNLL